MRGLTLQPRIMNMDRGVCAYRRPHGHEYEPDCWCFQHGLCPSNLHLHKCHWPSWQYQGQVPLFSLVPAPCGIRNRHEARVVWTWIGRFTVRINSLVVTEACYAANVHEGGPGRKPDWLTDRSRIAIYEEWSYSLISDCCWLSWIGYGVDRAYRGNYRFHSQASGLHMVAGLSSVYGN